MEFREAAAEIGVAVTSEDLAAALGVSLYTIRQARLQPGAVGYRNPPAGWEQAIARLAWRRASELAALAADLSHPGSAKVRAAMEKLAEQLERGGGNR